jgi:uncharacterized protein YxjI
MPNYTTANLVKSQLALNGAMAKQDTRFRSPEIWKLFLKNTEQFFPNYKELKGRDDKVLEANYFTRTSRALGTGRSHNHTGSKGDSGVLQPTWVTRNDKFSTSLKQADTSVFSFQQELDNELLNVVANFMDGMDSVASTYLVNNRTGVNTATVEGTFDATNDVFEITDTTNGGRAVQIAEMVMNINKYQQTRLTFVCDPISYNKFKFLAQQGSGNATNYSFQFGTSDFILDASLTAKAVAIDATYTKGFFEVIPQNTIGALVWIPKQNRQGVETTVNMYSTILNPFDGQQYAVHSYEERADGSATNGFTQDVKTEVEISLDVALEKAPLSVATETPIYAFALV